MAENYEHLTEEQKLVESVKHGEIYYAYTNKKSTEQDSIYHNRADSKDTDLKSMNQACADETDSNQSVSKQKRSVKDYTIWKSNAHGGGGPSDSYFAYSSGMPSDKVMEKIRDYLMVHYTEVESVSELARQFGYSKYHLMHSFKRVYGVTVHNFIEALKVRKAEELLIKSDQLVRTVSQNCGFNSDTYFIRYFRKVTGFTPEAYRRSHKQRNDTTEQ